MGYCIAFTAVWGLGTWQTSCAIAGNSMTTSVFKAKLEWDENEAIMWNTIISSTAILGLMMGSFAGGPLIPYGRRKTVIISMLICIFSVVISMYVNEYVMAIGRFLLGLGAGIFNVAFGKLINETLPNSIMSTFTMAHNFGICSGFMMNYFLGAVLPDHEDLEANKKDELWRVIWAFPAFIGIAEILLALFVMRSEPIAYCMMTGNHEEGKKHLKRVYRKKDPKSEETLEDIATSHYNFLRKGTSMEATSVTFKEAACGRKYRKATWVCFFYNMFNQQTGMNAISIYAG